MGSRIGEGRREFVLSLGRKKEKAAVPMKTYAA